MIVFLALALMPPQTVNILFVGNSLLNFNEVPSTVVQMLQSDGAGRRATSKAIFVGHLEDVESGSSIDREVTSGRYDFVVLQGAMVSSSRTRTYAQTRAIAMAKAAKARGSRVLLVVEWPRRGIDETEYTLNVYRGIQKRSGAELVPVCTAWNSVATRVDPAQLWSPDGNHAQPGGSFIAASCLYFQIAGVDRTPTYVPRGVPASLAARVLAESRKLFTNRKRNAISPRLQRTMEPEKLAPYGNTFLGG